MDSTQKQPFVERRKFGRISAQGSVFFSKYSFPRRFTISEGMMRNVSAGGILFQSREYFDTGEILKIELQFPGWEKYIAGFYRADAVSTRQPFVALGSVVRTESLSSGQYNVGLSLTGVDQGHQWALREYIRKKQKLSA